MAHDYCLSSNARARRRTMDGSNARSAVAPNTSASPSRPVSSLCPREPGARGRRRLAQRGGWRGSERRDGSRRSVGSARVFSIGGGTVKRRRPIYMLALVLGAVAAVPSIAAADTSFPAAAGDMTARGDLLVWAPWTGPGRLMSGFGDAAAELPIPRAY